MVLLTMPAIVITLVKYMRGIEAKRPLLPPVTRSQWAYMDTTPELVGIPRVVPPMTGSFVAAQADRLLRLQPGLRSTVSQGDFAPIMSGRLHMQLVAMGPHEGAYRLGLIGWHRKFTPVPQAYEFSGRRDDGSTATGSMEAYESVNLPLDVRAELQKYGYIIPPDGVVWLIVRFDGEAPIRAMDYRYEGNGVSIGDALTMPADAEGVP